MPAEVLDETPMIINDEIPINYNEYKLQLTLKNVEERHPENTETEETIDDYPSEILEEYCRETLPEFIYAKVPKNNSIVIERKKNDDTMGEPKDTIDQGGGFDVNTGSGKEIHDDTPISSKKPVRKEDQEFEASKNEQ
ncbi:7879_t:CDS:2, partial [Acaulospora morrowiae]